MLNEFEKDTYRTIEVPSGEGLFKDRGSKFLGYAFPLQREEEVKGIIQQLKETHYKARHWCYAWQLGKEESSAAYRVNDDGEPNNSAGQPIYGQLLSKDLTNILIVVVRYFGGTKLGVGGLITAYRTAAELALDAAKIVEKTIDVRFKLIFDYQDMNKVMRVIKERNLSVQYQKMEMNCEIEILARKNEAAAIEKTFIALRCLKIERV